MNELNFIKLYKNNPEVKKLYKEAFPKYERLPFFILKYLSRKTKSDFFGIYDDKQFVSLLYNVYYNDIVFIFYTIGK